jgi:hypothetical protein
MHASLDMSPAAAQETTAQPETNKKKKNAVNEVADRKYR